MSQNKLINNLAFIDGQNLFMGTTKRQINPWEIDLSRFYIYLKRKYKIDKAYYFLGCTREINQSLYKEIKDAGFILMFREHNTAMIGKKKGNVDSDIIFYIMKIMYKKENFEKIIIVSGDGDYKMLVDFLIEENKFEKILFPSRKSASSLYKKIKALYFDALDSDEIRNKIKKDP
jgi:uncharacterized LabA/DUF88 family protein